MVIIKEYVQPLNEMAYPCNRDDQAGMIIAINGSDHGVLGNARSPAHAHLLDLAGKEIGEFVITPKPPRKPSDIQWYRTPNIPEGYGKKIVDWANSKKRKLNVNCWAFLIASWNTRHP
jgi:hypothetical protein